MKILTWNFDGGGRDRWDEVLKYDPDIALLQECHDPEKHIQRRHINENDKVKGLVKGNVIYSKNTQPLHLDNSTRGGHVTVARVVLQNMKPLLIVNIHVKKPGGYIPNLHSIVDYLAGLEIIRASENLIVGGDLNLDIVYGRTNRPPRQRPVDRLLTEFNLRNCTTGPDGGRINTIKNCPEQQDDYIFLSPNMAERVVKLQVLGGVEKSKHYPVMVTLEGI